MGTLLLRLAAPLQSWGAEAPFSIRQTESLPTKSGVIGLVAAALGRRRDDPVADLAALRFGVRVVRPGTLHCDYHTVSRAPSPRPSQNQTDYVTRRYYLSNAVFIAGLESADAAFLDELERALHTPAFPLFLGRRCCPPTLPLSLGISSDGLEEALLHAECPETAGGSGGGAMRMLVDEAAATPSTALLRDLPRSFSPNRRQYGHRPAREIFVGGTEHDPFGVLEE